MNFNLSRWCVKHRQVVYFFTVLIFIAGIFSFHSLGRSETQTLSSARWSFPRPGPGPRRMNAGTCDQQAGQDGPSHTGHRLYYELFPPRRFSRNVILKEQVPNSEVRKHWLEVRNYVIDHQSELPDGIYGLTSMIVLMMSTAISMLSHRTASPRKTCAPS